MLSAATVLALASSLLVASAEDAVPESADDVVPQPAEPPLSPVEGAPEPEPEPTVAPTPSSPPPTPSAEPAEPESLTAEQASAAAPMAEAGYFPRYGEIGFTGYLHPVLAEGKGFPPIWFYPEMTVTFEGTWPGILSCPHRAAVSGHGAGSSASLNTAALAPYPVPSTGPSSTPGS